MSQEDLKQVNPMEELYGFTDDQSEELKSKQGGKFGLNENAFLTEFKLNTDDPSNPYIQYSIKIKDRDYNARIYDLMNEVKDFNSGKVFKRGTKEWLDYAKRRMKQNAGVVTHIFKAIGAADALKQQLSTPAKNFTDWANKIVAALPQDYQEKSLDVFLQYQKKIRKKQDRTWLELPNAMYNGDWIVEHIDPIGSWKEVITRDGLKYVDEGDNEHIFKRSKSFMDSSYAKVTELKTTNNDGASGDDDDDVLFG